MLEHFPPIDLYLNSEISGLCLLPHIRDKLQKPAKDDIQKIREIEWLYL